jgi:outer membrane protein assembly factor BamB
MQKEQFRMGRWLTWTTVLTAVAATAAADDWPQFRGPNRDNISRETGLLRAWPDGGPKVLWTVEVAQGYSAAAIHGGRVYFNDYSQQENEWYVRCLTLEEGKELWRFSESKRIRPNHGITRTVPAVDGEYVFSFDPKSVFHCLDAETGKELWRKAFVQEYKTRNPPWYNGQCPLIEPDRVVVAPGGEALMVALDKATGSEIWRTPNPDKWPMAHASVMPAELGGVKQYLWCTLKGLIGVSAADGAILWTFPSKFNVAVAPSPIAIDHERVFMTSGYDADGVMVRVTRDDAGFKAEKIFDLPSTDWNSEVHTPVVFENHIFAVGKKKRGLFTCLDLEGKQVWTSQGHASFELGSFLLADGMFFILEGKTGMLRLLEANTTEYRELASAQLLGGHDVWAPIALSDGKMVIRDMAKMICIEVGSSATARRDD